MTTSEPKFDSIVALLAASSTAIGVVEKRERNNTGKGFNFRGIDTVVNATSPEFREHGIIVVPETLERVYEQIEVGAEKVGDNGQSYRTVMGHVMLRVRYTFYGPAGDSIAATVDSEAFDSGDKATAKAMSVALRTALLQVLMLPTDEVDPDAQSFERAPAPAAKSYGSSSTTPSDSDDFKLPFDVGSHLKGETLREIAASGDKEWLAWFADNFGIRKDGTEDLKYAESNAARRQIAAQFLVGVVSAPATEPADYDDTPTFDENGCPF
jgi:hypothetical protein